MLRTNYFQPVAYKESENLAKFTCEVSTFYSFEGDFYNGPGSIEFGLSAIGKNNPMELKRLRRFT